MGDKGKDTRARVAALSDVMGVEACRVTARGKGMNIETARRGFGQQQRGHVRQPSGQQTQQRTRSRDHARTGILSVGNEVVESDTSQKRQEEENTGDPRAQAASRRQRDPTHIRNERVVGPDDGGAVVRPGRATTQWGHEKGGT